MVDRVAAVSAQLRELLPELPSLARANEASTAVADTCLSLSYAQLESRVSHLAEWMASRCGLGTGESALVGLLLPLLVARVLLNLPVQRFHDPLEHRFLASSE